MCEFEWDEHQFESIYRLFTSYLGLHYHPHGFLEEKTSNCQGIAVALGTSAVSSGAFLLLLAAGCSGFRVDLQHLYMVNGY